MGTGGIGRWVSWVLGGVVASTALGQDAKTGAGTSPWVLSGRLRSALGLVNTVSRSGSSFASSDAALRATGKSRDYTATLELEGGEYRVEGLEATTLVRVGTASIAWQNEPVRIEDWRMKLAGARRIGTDLVTRKGDEQLGLIDGLKPSFGGENFEVGIALGNTLGRFGGSSSAGESSMTLDPFAPGTAQALKAGRASLVFATATLAGLDLRLWGGQESSYFASPPTVTNEQVAGGAAPNGLAYERMQCAEASVGATFDGISFGAWAHKRWLRDPHAAVVKSNGEVMNTAAPTGVRSKWQELVGVGAEMQFGDEGKVKRVAGASVVAARSGSEGLEKGSAAAKAEEDNDLRQVAVAVGLKDGAVTASLNAALNSTAGKVFPDQDGKAGEETKRSIVYVAANFAM